MAANFSGKRSAMRVASVPKSATPLPLYVSTSLATAPTRFRKTSVSNSGLSKSMPSVKLESNAQNAVPTSFGLRAVMTFPCVSTWPKYLLMRGT